MRLCNASYILRRQLCSGVQGTAVCLERTVVAADLAPQQRPAVAAGGQFLALTESSTSVNTNNVPRGCGMIGRPLSAFSVFSPSFTLPAAPHYQPQFLLQQLAGFLYYWAACSAFPSPDLQLTLPSISPSSVSSDQQVVVYRPDGPRSILLPLLASCLYVLLKRHELAHDIRNYVQYKVALKSIRSESLRLLRKAHQKRLRLDKHDRYAILDYTGPGFAVLNKALRSGAVSADIQQRIDGVVRAMSKRQMKVYQGTVYRGAKLPSTIQDTLCPGDTFSDAAFLSCSSKKASAFVSKGRTLFEIKSKTGVDISAQSEHKNEAEVLFRPNTMFKIKSVEEKYDDRLHGFVTLVAMEELV